MTEKCQHKWKHNIRSETIHSYDGYDNYVTLKYTDWCEKCYMLKERVSVFKEVLIKDRENWEN